MKTAEDVAFSKRVGKMIRIARRQQHVSQLQLAERIGTSQSAISEIETGLGVTVWFLRRIAAGLGYKLRISFERSTDKHETT